MATDNVQTEIPITLDRIFILTGTIPTYPLSATVQVAGSYRVYARPTGVLRDVLASFNQSQKWGIK